MNVAHQDLLKIVEEASTLTERISDSFIPDETKDNEKLISSRWELWYQAVAKGNLDTFAKRLSWDGLYPSAISKVLGNVRLANPKQLPVWAETLWKVLQTDWQTAYIEVYRCLDPEKPIPFEEVYLPFVYVAQQKLIAKVGTSWQLLSDTAQINLEYQLLSRIGSLCDQSLYVEFLQFKASQEPSGSNEQYKAFVEDLKTGKLLSFFQQYSVLARLVATAMDFWVEEKTEFLQRLALDLPTIQETFKEDTGLVVAIKLNLSDLHNRGRSVIALTFASGLKLIYKPRNLGLEAAYFQLLAWCNQNFVLTLPATSLHPFKLLKVLNRSDYGWMEYAEQLPCADEAGAQRYYLRAGMILCLTYVLGGYDFHKENLVASGEHPVLVDLETLLAPEPRTLDPKMTLALGAQYVVSQQFSNSVLKTDLLPRWDVGPGGQVKDVSGLGGVGEGVTLQRPKWQKINTDSMTLNHEYVRVPAKANTLLLNGTILSSSDYIDEIVEGFQQMYQFLREHTEALLATDSPLATLADQEVRFLFRNSQFYDNLLKTTLQPKFLQHGVDRSIKLDALSRALLAPDEQPGVWSLLAVERLALEQMDIPYFSANSSSNALVVNSELIIEEYFEELSYNQAISRLQQLSDADLAQQIAIIRGSLYSRIAQGMTDGASTHSVANIAFDNKVGFLTPEQLVQEAVEIARELQQRAIHVADNVTWLGMQPWEDRVQFQPLGDSLYDGVSGIALFLAAVVKITGCAEFRDLALNALQELRKAWLEPEANFQKEIAQQIPIGGADGAGSIIYTLVRISQFLDEPDLLETATHVASCINQESIVSDSQFDTMGGAAGAILGLLTLYQVKPDPSILEKAQALGYHLLENRVASESGFRAWATLEGKLTTGLAHGASGIAYTFLRLYKKTQYPAFLEAAEEAIAYERSVFSPKVGNWPIASTSARGTDQSSFMVSWCYGAPGIGLARLGGLEILDDLETKQEIAVALSTTQQFGLQNVDHLCCGNFGRVETLLVAAQKLSYPELWETAQKQAAQIVTRKKQLGAFYLFPDLPKDVYNPGFFRGTAGIGYELLRLAYPDLLASVLLWE